MPNDDRGMAVHRTEDNFRTGLMLVVRMTICSIVLVTIAATMVLLLPLVLLRQPLGRHSLARSRYVTVSNIFIPTAQCALHLDLIVIFRIERIRRASHSLLVLIMYALRMLMCFAVQTKEVVICRGN